MLVFKVQEVSPQDCGLIVEMAGQSPGAKTVPLTLDCTLFAILDRPRESLFLSHLIKYQAVTSLGQW